MGKEDKTAQCPKCYTLNPEDSQFCSKCGSALETFQETLSYTPDEEAQADEAIQFKPGDIFDKRYRIIEEIGRGGMGRVYKAEDTELNITVALKMIRPKYSSHPVFIERFKKETLTARSISHDNVIRIHDLGEAENIKYISMEYIKGQNLRDFIQASGSLSIETIVNISRQICEALVAAHKKGILHQDLKPSNIMLDNSGQAYIMDFGLARSLFTEDASIKGTITGTPQYMSPEQVEGKKLDKRSDVYALGVIMYEMVTGKLLFDADTKEEIFQKQVTETPKPPSKINPNVPPLLQHIILKSLEKDREKRYQSADEIIAELDKLKLQPVQLSLTSWLKRFWYVPLAAIAALFIIISINLWKKTPPSPFLEGKRISLAIMYFMNNTGDKNLDYMGKTFCELLIADLLQSKHIRVITGDKLFDILQKLNLLEVSAYSSEDLMQVASLLGVDFILQGHITKGGELFRIDASIHNAKTMEPIGADSVQGEKEESVFSMVDGMTRKIKENFNLSPETIARDIDKDVTTITTNSPEAMKLYIDGKMLYRTGKFQESIRILEKAVALDPEFALAHVKISEDYNYLGNVEQADKYLTKALSLLNKVSEREYYLIQAYAAYTPEMEMENYQKLLELYPDDLEAIGYLASRYRNTEEWDLALENFEKIIAIDPQEELAYENVAYVYTAKGQYEKARNILTSNQQVFTNPLYFHIRLATCYLLEGKHDLAIEETHKARSLDPDYFEINELLGHIHLIRGDIESAEKAFRQMIEAKHPLSQYLGNLWLAHLHLMRGEYDRLTNEIARLLEIYKKSDFLPGMFNFQILDVYIKLQKGLFPEALVLTVQAMEAANKAAYIDYRNSALYFRGLAYARMKRIKEARDTADELKKQIQEIDRKKLMRHYHHLRGEIALAEGEISRAIDDFEIAVSLLPEEYFKHDIHILFLDSLASAYYENEDWEKAQKEYEKITSLKTGRLRWGDKYSLAFFWLGKIHQMQDNADKAVECYKKFLEIWSNADAGLPEIEEARKQLEALGETIQE